MQEKGKTLRKEMLNNSINPSQSVDGMQNDMTAPFVNETDGGEFQRNAKRNARGYRKMTSRKEAQVVDIIIINPGLPEQDGAESGAPKLYKVKFNPVTHKVLSFAVTPHTVEGVLEDFGRDPLNDPFYVMDLDEHIPEEATRDLAEMQRFFDDPARDAFFDRLAQALRYMKTRTEKRSMIY